MSHELICGWLGLSADAWPPDHYRLLGLEPGEPDIGLIEQRVHQRLDSVRRYQMIHPEPATEAMNRLAQAFVCLTEPLAKKAYDRTLPGTRCRTPPPPPPPKPAKPEARDPLVWLYSPGVPGPGVEAPPAAVRTPPPPPPPVARVQAAEPTVEVLPVVKQTEPTPAPSPAEPVDAVREAARSAQARQGISSRRALYQRVARTRELLRLWHKMRKHLDEPSRQLTKQEAAELAKLVERTEDAVTDFPLLGEAGQPGYLIVSLTTLDRTRDLRNLTFSQRESLQRDWSGGLRFLEEHRDLLREQIRRDRRRSWATRMMRAMRGVLNEQPVAAILVLLVLLALGIAVWRSWLAG